MGSSFCNIGERGFWSRDWLLEVWLRLLALRLEHPTAPGSPIERIRGQFLLASTGWFNGCVPHGLDEAVATPEGADAVRRATDILLAALDAGPAHIPAAGLDLLAMSGHFPAGLAASDLVAIGQAFRDLLDGRITWTAADAPVLPPRRPT